MLWLFTAMSSIVHFEPTPADILGVIMILAFFGLGLRIPIRIGSAGLLVGLFLLANILSSMLAPDPTASFRSLSVRFYLFLSWLLLTCLIYENPVRVLRVLWSGYTIAAIIAVALGILGYYRLVPFYNQLIEFGRVRALFKDPNVYGPFLVPVVLHLSASLEPSGKRVRFYLTGILIVFIVFGVLLGFSRGSWLNLAISLFLFVILSAVTQTTVGRKRRVLMQAGGGLILIVLFLGWAISTHGIHDMIEARTKLQAYDLKEGTGRFSIQKQVLNKSFVTPLGIGAGQSEEKYNFGKAPHNVYLHVLIESGWLGAAAFYGFLLLTLWKSYHYVYQRSSIQRYYIATFACVVGCLAQSFFIDSTHWRHFYLLLAMLWGPLLAWQSHPERSE
jgi:O-antigen ligase